MVMVSLPSKFSSCCCLWLRGHQCANTGFQPDPNKVSFSCRIASGLRALPEGERPDLIALLKEYGDSIEGFRERVGDDFARGHKEATGGIIAKVRCPLIHRDGRECTC